MGKAVYMLLQEKQLSDFSPAYFEFSRFSDGSKLNSSPRCCQSVSTDGTKVSNFFGNKKKKGKKITVYIDPEYPDIPEVPVNGLSTFIALMGLVAFGVGMDMKE